MSGSSLSHGVSSLSAGLTEAQHSRALSWVQVFSEAWATGEWGRLLEVVHQDASIFYPGMGEVTDRDGLRDFFQSGFAMMPDFRIHLERWAAAADDVLIEWHAKGTVGDSQIEWSGMDRFTFRGEAIVEARAYYDTRPITEAMERSFGESAA
jgi:limonene-1,2-epoxide hydrolase